MRMHDHMDGVIVSCNACSLGPVPILTANLSKIGPATIAQATYVHLASYLRNVTRSYALQVSTRMIGIGITS